MSPLVMELLTFLHTNAQATVQAEATLAALPDHLLNRRVPQEIADHLVKSSEESLGEESIDSC